MKQQLLARIRQQAEAENVKLRDEINQLAASLHQIAGQREVLAQYRQRLRQSWQNQETLAGLAQQAGYFTAASRQAEAQIERMEADAKIRLNTAVQKLADLNLRRQILENAELSISKRHEAKIEQQRDREFSNQAAMVLRH